MKISDLPKLLQCYKNIPTYTTSGYGVENTENGIFLMEINSGLDVRY